MTGNVMIQVKMANPIISLIRDGQNPAQNPARTIRDWSEVKYLIINNNPKYASLNVDFMPGGGDFFSKIVRVKYLKTNNYPKLSTLICP
jgi:hypothetical protein